MTAILDQAQHNIITLQCLQKLIEREKREKNTGLSVDLAIVYTGLGQIDKAFEQLEQAFEDKHGGLLFIRSIHWEELNDDPRMTSLLKRMNLHDEQSNLN